MRATLAFNGLILAAKIDQDQLNENVLDSFRNNNRFIQKIFAS